MRNFLNKILKIFSKGIILGFWFIFIIFLASVSYATFTWFSWLNAISNETLTAQKWNDMVDAVRDEYSTTETLTSKIWVDGKPIYRIVVSDTINAWDATWIKRIDTTSLNIDKAIEIEYRIGNSALESSDVISTSSWSRAAEFRPDGIYTEIWSSYNGLIFQAILEYTKN